MRDNFLWVWLLLLLGGVFLGTAVVRQTVVRLDYQPIVTDALTSFPIEPTSKAVDSLSEHTTIIQRFIAPVSYISDITIGVRNFRKAPSDALLVVDLVNAQDTIISSVTVQVGSFGSNDLTSVPLSSVLHVGDSYSILLHTMGIVKEHAVTVSYEPSVESYPKGSLHIRNDITGKIRDIDGNIRFQLLRRPTLRAVLVTLLH
ncbi:MAG: hypothetical protein ABIP54_05105, partial [Candidatus Andersenbacteria bacterium]